MTMFSNTIGMDDVFVELVNNALKMIEMFYTFVLIKAIITLMKHVDFVEVIQVYHHLH